MERRRFLMGLGAFAGALAVPEVPKLIVDMGRSLALPHTVGWDPAGAGADMTVTGITVSTHEYGAWIRASDLVEWRRQALIDEKTFLAEYEAQWAKVIPVEVARYDPLHGALEIQGWKEAFLSKTLDVGPFILTE